MGTIRDCVKPEDFGKFGLMGGCIDFPDINSVCLVDDIEKQITKTRFGSFLDFAEPCFWHLIKPYPSSHHIE